MRQPAEILFTNAGHVPPLWYRAATRRWSLLDKDTPHAKEIADLPLGMIPGTPYQQTAVQLEPGDLLLLYTDGINESCDPTGDQLGLDGLISTRRLAPNRIGCGGGRGPRGRGGALSRFDTAADDETVVALERIA